jgi:putative addiction module component (TIGR02574 family)
MPAEELPERAGEEDLLRRASVPSIGGNLVAMKDVSVAEILELPIEERIRLVEVIWDSIAAVPESVSLPEEWKGELNRRLAEFEADPEGGSPWEEVRSRIRQGAWRTA